MKQLSYLPSTATYDWVSQFEGRRKIAISKLKLNFTNDSRSLATIEQLLRSHAEITLSLANPLSPAVWLRYREEPNPLWSTVPSYAPWTNGLEELAHEVENLLSWKEDLFKRGVDATRLHLKTTSHYPSQAIYQFDDELFVFHYPFGERGFQAPCFLFANPDEESHRFYLRVLKRSLDSAAPLEEIGPAILSALKAGGLSDTRVAEWDIGREGILPSAKRA